MSKGITLGRTWGDV